MGQTQSYGTPYVYAVPVGSPDDGQFIAACVQKDICSFVDCGLSRLVASKRIDNRVPRLVCEQWVGESWDMFKRTVTKQPRRPFLGRRFRNEKGQLGDYEWMNFAEAEAIALSFGTSLITGNLVPEIEFPEEAYVGARKMRLLGLYSKNCVEWLLAEQGCNAYGVTVCPLYDTLGEDSIDFILRQTKLQTVLVAFDCFDSLIAVLATENDKGELIRKDGIDVKTVILIDPTSEDTRHVQQGFKDAVERGKVLRVDVLIWHEVVAGGVDILPPSPGSRQDVSTLCFTSGTTGMPKGVILTHGNLVSVVCGALRGPVSPQGFFSIGATDTIVSYLPLAHVFERCVCNIVICTGGSIGLYSGDMAKLLDDIKVLQPTIFLSVPRLFNRINDKIALTLQDKKMPTQILFNQGLNSKINRRRNESVATHKLWDTIVFAKIRAMMGTRLRGMISGGAPLDPLVCERMTAFFSAPLMQGFGLSESFGPCCLMHPSDSAVGPVGGIWPATEFKLISVPELDYLVTDKPPRGELCLRGPGVAVGYFMNEEATKAAWDEDNWFHTGDVALLVARTNAIQIIDRKKNIFKLSQGEYVAPEKIEAIYGQAILISQIFVFGYSDKTSLVAIVSPDMDAAAKWATRFNCSSDAEALCKNEALKAAIMTEMEQVAQKNSLKGFEKVKSIHLTPEAFTVENSLLTPTSKIRRSEAKKMFVQEINSMYKKLGQ